jgi:hypothetical protein
MSAVKETCRAEFYERSSLIYIFFFYYTLNRLGLQQRYKLCCARNDFEHLQSVRPLNLTFNLFVQASDTMEQ